MFTSHNPTPRFFQIFPATAIDKLDDAHPPPAKLEGPCHIWLGRPVAAIDWLCTAFGFTKRMVVPGQNGTVLHAELSIGPGVIMVGSSRPEQGWVSPRRLSAASQGMCVYVDDPDAHHAHAKRCGVAFTKPQ